jgi:hypothetical protein
VPMTFLCMPYQEVEPLRQARLPDMHIVYMGCVADTRSGRCD